MVKSRAIQISAYSPAGISSFFRIHGPIRNPTGATGGGFTITKGVTTHVTVQRSEKTSVEVFVNRCLNGEAVTSLRVADMLLRRTLDKPLKVSIRHFVEPPVGAGFGTSAAAALSLSLALSKVLDLKLTLKDVARIAHEAEIACRTGLGTVAALTVGGCVVTYKPGQPGTCRILRIPVDPDLMIIAAYFNSELTGKILRTPHIERRVNRWGEEALQKILGDPSVETLMAASREFASKAGFTTGKVEATIKVMKRSGALAAAQNMLGEAVHAAAYREEVGSIVEALREDIKPRRILTSEIGGTPKILAPISKTDIIQPKC